MSTSFSPALSKLFEHLRCLPGVGQRSAQRMAFHLLQRDRAGGKALAVVLQQAMDDIGYCESCRTLSEDKLCPICIDDKRDVTLLCVVENPADMAALEHSGYKGRYFVLLGRLSPIEGIGADDIGFDALCERLNGVHELIIATSSTVEGSATAAYLCQHLAQANLNISRIASGVPVGGELDFVDYGTLSHALLQRQLIKGIK